MDPNQNSRQSSPLILALKLIWLVLTTSQIMYVWVANLITQSSTPKGSLLPGVIQGFGVLAGGVSLASLILYQRCLSRPKIEELFQKTGMERTLKKSFIFSIIVWALNESIVLYGLVLTILAGKFELILPFAAIGLLLNGITYPKVSAALEKESSQK